MTQQSLGQSIGEVIPTRLWQAVIVDISCVVVISCIVVMVRPFGGDPVLLMAPSDAPHEGV
jgi:hypothetical protein